MHLYGLLAHPVSHSLSPVLYGRFFEECGMNHPGASAKNSARFELFDVTPEHLGAFFERVRTEKISGLAVSIPHKEAVLDFLDDIDPVAKEIGAVNTIGWLGEKLVGWNTDWLGVTGAFAEAGVDVSGKRAMVLGAGGAARAVVYALAKMGADVVVTNRHFEKAEDLASQFRCGVIDFEDRETVAADIVVNATSVGLEDENTSPVSAKFWRRPHADAPQIAFDLVYRPRMTKFLRDAQEAGAKIISGDRMLLHQGRAQFQLLTGKLVGVFDLESRL